jgi:hypothetical protein
VPHAVEGDPLRVDRPPLRTPDERAHQHVERLAHRRRRQRSPVRSQPQLRRAGLILLGAGVALAATIPFLTRAQEWAWSRFCKLAETQSGLTAEEIVTRLGQLDEGVRLLSRTVNALRVAPYEEKLRILASSISIAAHDSTLINEELLVVAAIEALEPYHLRLLHAGEKAARIDRRGPSDWDYTADKVQAEDAGLTSDIVEMLSGTLASLGLITTPVATDIPLYSVTRLGQLVLERARTVEEE